MHCEVENDGTEKKNFTVAIRLYKKLLITSFIVFLFTVFLSLERKYETH